MVFSDKSEKREKKADKSIIALQMVLILVQFVIERRIFLRCWYDPVKFHLT
jgi:hypothetical protein